MSAQEKLNPQQFGEWSPSSGDYTNSPHQFGRYFANEDGEYTRWNNREEASTSGRRNIGSGRFAQPTEWRNPEPSPMTGLHRFVPSPVVGAN